MSYALEIKALDFHIREFPILSDISLSVEKHEFVGLIGPNGSGKSSMLKHVYQHYVPKKGSIYLNGSDVLKMKSKEIAREMSVVAQENQQDFDFSVREMLLMGRYAHKKLWEEHSSDDEVICREALNKVGLSHVMDRSFLSLSGGEKQRIYLAMALAQGSEIMILDEPTNHLDIGYQLYTMEILRKFQEKTIFMSVHDMNLAATYCDRLILLDHGKVIVQGKPAEVLTKQNILDIFHVEVEVTPLSEDGKVYLRYLRYQPLKGT